MRRQSEFAPPPKTEKPKKPWEGGGERRDTRPPERRPEQPHTPRADMPRRDDAPRGQYEPRPSFSPPRPEERRERPPQPQSPRAEQRAAPSEPSAPMPDAARSSLKAAIAAVRGSDTHAARSPLDVLRERKASKPPEPMPAPQKSVAPPPHTPPPREPRPSTPPPSNPHEQEAAPVRRDISRDNASDDISEDMLRRLLRDDR